MKVSACIIAFMHEKYIANCIEGAIAQNVAYDYEIVIGVDKCSDNTLKICKEYQLRYPNKIIVLEQEKNLGMIGNWINALMHCKGDFIAVCEGDDYWSNPNKLKIQTDYLLARTKNSSCFHNVEVFNDVGVDSSFQYPQPAKESLFFKDILFKHYIPTCSFVFRSSILKKSIDFEGLPMIDIPLQLLAAQFGPIGYISENFGVYRRHLGGITFQRNQLLNARKGYIRMYKRVRVRASVMNKILVSLVIWKTYLGFIKDRFNLNSSLKNIK
jgi:glycosyltransferase involved in cell wall biosynthesis